MFRRCSILFWQVKDQQEAERKKVASLEMQQALEAQTKVIAEKQESVRKDLAQVEPAVTDAQQGKLIANTHFRYCLYRMSIDCIQLCVCTVLILNATLK